jgi:hypothetical protein
VREITHIYNRFPWSQPVNIEFDDSDEGFFCDTTLWSFNQAQLSLIYKMLEEVENWFLSHDKPIEVIIVEYKEVLGYVFVDKICGYPGVDEIFDKYRTIYIGEAVING